MAYQTTFSKLDDAELLARLDDKRQYSPVVEELCQRLEKQIGRAVIASDAGREKDCPICEASLAVDYDPSIDQFTLGVIRS